LLSSVDWMLSIGGGLLVLSEGAHST